MDFISAYTVTILVETSALFFLLRRRYGAPAIIRNSVIASSLTLPFVWFAFPALAPMLGLGWALQTLLAELFAFCVEAAVYQILFERMGWADAARLSFACNLLSFVAGSIL